MFEFKVHANAFYISTEKSRDYFNLQNLKCINYETNSKTLVVEYFDDGTGFCSFSVTDVEKKDAEALLLEIFTFMG